MTDASAWAATCTLTSPASRREADARVGRDHNKAGTERSGNEPTR